MPAPVNQFKKALKDGQLQVGCWLSMADRYAAEISSTAGFDWLLVDGEHAPNDLRSIRDQLQVIDAATAHAIVRLPVGEPWMIKQVLDAGAQSILIPMVESAEQAELLVRAVRYPPAGMRGVGSSAARASRFGAIDDYLPTADDQICLLVQIENRAGLAALDDISAIEGIDGIFIGPADLAADLGHLGGHEGPEVRAIIEETLSRIVKAGKAAGILAPDPDFARRCVDLGATFVATDIDVTLFINTMRDAARRARELKKPA